MIAAPDWEARKAELSAEMLHAGFWSAPGPFATLAQLALMDRAAGLDHQELTGRSLWLPGKP